MMPVRLRDFIEDADGWLYAVSTYDNDEKVGCVLRYVPNESGERVNPHGARYKKYDFEEAYAFIADNKPAYSNLVQRIPIHDVKKVLKPDVEIPRIACNHVRVQKLLDLFRLPKGTIGCTGSLLCGLENETSDIDMVVYGRHWSGRESLTGSWRGSLLTCGGKYTRNVNRRSPMIILCCTNCGNGTGGKLRVPISTFSIHGRMMS